MAEPLLALQRGSVRWIVALGAVLGVVLPVCVWWLARPDQVRDGLSLHELLGLVAAQLVVAVALMALILQWRLIQPLRLLKRQANRLAAAEDAELPPSTTPVHQDELAELDHHLQLAQHRIDELVGQLEASNTELHRLAMYDPLTGLPNRRLFRELFEHAQAVAKRSRQQMALLFIDLDRFKHINDTHGHQAGDALLRTVSQRLRETARESDLVGRLSGDEFIALLPQADNFQAIAHTALRLIHAVEEPVPIDGQGELLVRVSATIGVSRYPRDGEAFDELLRRADQAMYRAKALGRGRFALYRDGQTPGAAPVSGPDDEIRQALRRGEMSLHTQALVDTSHGQGRGHEFYLRWQHPTEGLLKPARFLRRAEEHGQLMALARFTLEAACLQLARWGAKGHRVGHVSVNVSEAQFRHPDWADVLVKVLDRHRPPRGMLEVELSEASLMADPEAMPSRMDMLRDLGISVTVDDFGAGLISLASLAALKPRRVKLDASFAQRLPDDPIAKALVDGVVRLGRSLDFEVCAKGVETEDQRDWLHRLGCERQQGHLFGPVQAPLDAPPWPLPTWTAHPPRQPTGASTTAPGTLGPPLASPAYRSPAPGVAASRSHNLRRPPKAH